MSWTDGSRGVLGLSDWGLPGSGGSCGAVSSSGTFKVEAMAGEMKAPGILGGGVSRRDVLDLTNLMRVGFVSGVDGAAGFLNFVGIIMPSW